MWLSDLNETLHDAGLRVEEVPGWKTRGYQGRTLESVQTITCHHTAPGIHSLKPRLSLATIRDGRPGLSGPLAQLYLDRDGTWYTVAAGLCNHAGVSRRVSFTNKFAVGIEAEAAGDGWDEDWPRVQMDSYAAGCAALIRRYQLPIGSVLGHKETCEPVGRKSDPSFDMTKFRAKVRDWKPAVESQSEDDDMNLSDKVRVGPGNSMILKQTDGAITVEESIATQTAASVQTNNLLAELLTEIRGLRQQIGAL